MAICPIRKTPKGRDAECKKDGCQWWADKEEMCSVTSLAIALWWARADVEDVAQALAVKGTSTRPRR